MATINTPIINKGSSSTQQISHSSSTNIHRLHNWVFLTEVGKTANTEFVSFDNVTIKITDDGTNRFLTVYLAGHNLIVDSIFNLTLVNPTTNNTYFDNNPTFTVTTVVNTAIVQVNLGNVLLNLGNFTASINYTRTVSYTSADIGKRCRVVENNTFYDLVSFDVSNAPVWVNAHGASTLQSEGDLISTALDKTTPVNTDQIGLMDSSASNVLKKLSWFDIKANLKSYFDSIYQTVLVSGTSIKTINNSSILGSGDINISSGTANSSGYTTTVNELSSLITNIPTSVISADLTETFLLSEPFSNQITTYTYSTVGAYGGCYIYNNTTVIATIKTTTNSDTSGGFILKSTDAGISFNSIRNTIRPNLLACSYPIILCTTRTSTNDDTLTYSVDGGTSFSTWTPSGGIFTSISVSPNGSIWAATFKNTSTAIITFYIITNNGATRTPINTSYIGTVPFISINNSGEFLFFNADFLAIIKYIPFSFYTILQLFGYSNEIATGISSVYCDNNFNYIYFTDYNHSLYRSDNKGVSFTKIYTNSSNIPDGLVCSNDGSNVYMLSSPTSYGIISSDYGNSFTSLAYHTYYRPIVYLSSSNKYALFAGTAYNTGQLGTYTLNNTKRVPLSDLYTGISQWLPADLIGLTTNNNTFLGAYAGVSANTAVAIDNTLIGVWAGANITTGSNNICIGSSSGTEAAFIKLTTENNYVVLGNNSTTNARIKVAWTVGSDERDKTNISYIDTGLSFINNLKPVQFKYRLNRDTEETAPESRLRYGFLAQDILPLEDTSVIVDDTTPEVLGVNETMLIPILVNAIKELTTRIELLEAKIN